MVLKDKEKYAILKQRFNLPENINGYFKVKCERCKQSINGYAITKETKLKELNGIDIIFHYIDGNRENDNPKNILVVCYKCHGWGTHLKQI